MNPGASVYTTINGIALKIFRLKHMMDSSGTRTTNFAYLIQLGGMKILQMGDITIEFDLAYLEPMQLQNENIDILFLPYFDLSEISVKFVKEVIKPSYVIAKHLPPAAIDSESKKFHGVFPDGIVFGKPLETKLFTK